MFAASQAAARTQTLWIADVFGQGLPTTQQDISYIKHTGLASLCQMTSHAEKGHFSKEREYRRPVCRLSVLESETVYTRLVCSLASWQAGRSKHKNSDSVQLYSWNSYSSVRVLQDPLLSSSSVINSPVEILSGHLL